MKLIYIATSVIPAQKANSYQVMKMCERFTCEGADVKLLIPVRFGGVRAKDDPFDYYGIKKRFKIKKIFSIDLIPFEKYIGHLGFWIQNASFTILASLYCLFRKSDVIYTRDKFTLSILVLFKKNLVWEAHSFPRKFFWPYRFILRRLHKLIVVSKGLKEEFLGVDFPAERILVAPDAVDLDEFNIKESPEECREKLNLPVKKKIILYTGHLFKWKGVFTLAEASQYLGDDSLVVVVGGMDRDLENYKIYLEKNKYNKVKALGFKNHKDIPYFLRAADVLVLPNSSQEKISTTYTSPLKLFEYLASGRPLVVSDLPSLREILSEKEAVFVKPDSAKSLAWGIKQVLESNDLSDKITRNGQRLVKNYTWEKRARKILGFIKK